MGHSNFASLGALDDMRASADTMPGSDRHCMTVRVSALGDDGHCQFATIIMEAECSNENKIESAVKSAIRAWSKVMNNEVLSVVMEVNSSERLLEQPRTRPRLELIQGDGLLTGAIERSLKIVGCGDPDVREAATTLDLYLP